MADTAGKGRSSRRRGARAGGTETTETTDTGATTFEATATPTGAGAGAEGTPKSARGGRRSGTAGRNRTAAGQDAVAATGVSGPTIGDDLTGNLAAGVGAAADDLPLVEADAAVEDLPGGVTVERTGEGLPVVAGARTVAAAQGTLVPTGTDAGAAEVPLVVAVPIAPTELPEGETVTLTDEGIPVVEVTARVEMEGLPAGEMITRTDDGLPVLNGPGERSAQLPVIGEAVSAPGSTTERAEAAPDAASTAKGDATPVTREAREATGHETDRPREEQPLAAASSGGAASAAGASQHEANEAAGAAAAFGRRSLRDSADAGRTVFDAWAYGTETALRAVFEIQNAALSAGLSLLESGADRNRDLAQQWSDGVRRTQRAVLSAWDANIRAIDTLASRAQDRPDERR